MAEVLIVTAVSAVFFIVVDILKTKLGRYAGIKERRRIAREYRHRCHKD